MRPAARELSALIGAVYDAGLDPTGAGWPAVLDRLSPAIAGEGTVVLGVERRRFEYGHTHYARTDADAVVQYQTHYGRVDPVFEPVIREARPGVLLLSDALMPARELRRTEYYADWIQPQGFGSAAAMVLMRHGSAQALVYAVRPRRRGLPTAEDIEALELLLPHVAAAVRVSLRVAALGAQRDAVAEVLDRWAEAVLLVDDQAAVHAANRAAEALLGAGDGISVEPARGLARGRLRAATPALTAALRRLVRDAAAVAVPRYGKSADAAPRSRELTMALARPSGRPALAITGTPLSPGPVTGARWIDALAGDAPHATVIVFVSDPATAGDASTARERLRALYGLTPAESAVAVAVAGGEGLRAVAAAQRVTLATVRTQVQRVYQKTGMRGQVALARLVERIAQLR